MKKNKQHNIFHRRALATAVLAAIWNLPVQAMELDTGNEDLAVRFDNTFKYNYGVRTENADKRILGSPNSNDGDYNFRHAGSNVTNRVDILSELDLVFKENYGLRVSAASWYDRAYENTGSNSNPFVNGNGATSGQLLPQAGPLGPLVTADDVGMGSRHLSHYAQRYYTGPSGEILDAFVFASTEIGEESLLSGKAGKHNLYWGESLLNPIHAISYGQSGLDLAKLAASPGIEAKELFRPRNQLSTSFTLNQEWSFAGQYFLDWDAARLPEDGTYYGGSDVIQSGGQGYLLGHTGTAGFVAPNMLANLKHGHDITPDKRGDYGLMAKWAPEWLDGTAGAYYRHTADILPQAWLDGRGLRNDGPLNPAGGAPAGVLGNNAVNLLNSLNTASYQFAYADDIDIYGLSLSKSIGGISVGSDLNYRRNMPLASNSTVVSPYLAGGGTGALAGALPPRTPGTGVVAGISGDDYSATGDTLHWVVNGLATFADTPVFDAATLLGEVWYNHLISIDDKNKALYKGEDTYRGVDKSTKNSYGVSVNFTPTWFQVFPGIDMTMPISVASGLSGVSAVSGGGAKGTGQYGIGVGMQIYNQYFVDLKYVDAFGKTESCRNGQTDGATPNGLDAEEDYTCYGSNTAGGASAVGAPPVARSGAGSYSSFSGSAASIEDRGAVYLTAKTTF